MSTYSGSGSSGATSARPVRATVRSVQPRAAAREVEDLQEPGGACGMQTVVVVLVALVLDDDRRVAAARCDATESG